MTRQEEELYLDPVRNVHYLSDDHFKVAYDEQPPVGVSDGQAAELPKKSFPSQPFAKGRQLKLF